MLSHDGRPLTAQDLHEAMIRIAARAPKGEKRKRESVLRMTCALSLAECVKQERAR